MASSGDASGNSSAIVSNRISISGGSITATAGNSTGTTESAGTHLSWDHTAARSLGLSAPEYCIITGGTINVTTGNVNNRTLSD